MPEREPFAVIDGHPVEETWYASVVRVARYGGDFNTIQAAIDYCVTQTPTADSPWTVKIYPGIYDEDITMSSWVNLRGVGPKGSVVIFQEDNTIIQIADNVELQNLTVRLGTPAVNFRYMIYDFGVVCTARMTDLVFEIETPGAFRNSIFTFSADGGNYTIERCSHRIAGDGQSYTIWNTGSPSTIRLIDNDFEWTASTTACHIRSDVAGTWTGAGNRWAGICGLFDVSNGTFTFDNDAMICTGAWANTGATITLRNCAIEAPVVAGSLATVRMKNCSYRAIQRTGTGNIVDESAHLQDAPWKVHKWDWMTALANVDIGVRGDPLDAGSGQVLLEVNPIGAADQEAVETNTEAGGALGNEFTPARTPRFLTQIAVDDFHADVTMFFGLRQSLGDAVPLAAAEHYAGFAWDNLDASVNKFWAISSDGTQQITLLTTPSVDVQHQLEVIVFGGITEVGWVEFYIDGVLVITHETRIPVNGLDWQHLLATLGLGADVDIDVTVRLGGCQECPS